MQMKKLMLALMLMLVVPGFALAQEWRGQGRIAGKITDEAGTPIEGVSIKAILPSSENRGPGAQKSNAKGDWSIGGIAGGMWSLDFEKDGYETVNKTVQISEVNRLPAMPIVMKKMVVAVDPNEVIKDRLVEAAALMTKKEFAAARGIYEALAQQYPQVKQFKPLIARAQFAEGKKAEAITTLKAAVAEDPANIEIQVLLGTLLIETGQMAEGQQVLSAIDASKVSDPIVLVNIGISLINDKKQAEAITWFDKAIAVFPNDPSAYYFRGISHLGLGRNAEAKADLQKFISIAPANAPELDAAKKILDTIKTLPH
jgi:tetratricopeptide (TPR) repeat protein